MEIVRRVGIIWVLLTAFTIQLQAQTTAEQPIPAAVMKELEAMKKRIEQLEAELSNRDAHQPPTQLVEETAGGPDVSEGSIAPAA